MNEPIFNDVCTSFAIRQQWLPPGVTNCMVFNFKQCIHSKYECLVGKNRTTNKVYPPPFYNLHTGEFSGPWLSEL